MNERLDRTKALPTEQVSVIPPRQRKPDFQPGKAAVPSKRPMVSPEPVVVSPAPVPRPAPAVRDRLRMMRIGRGWTSTGSIVLLICWGLWASDSGGTVFTEALILALIFVVALGLFVVSRLAGGVVFEKMMGRRRRGAVLSHMAVGLFLAVVGFKLLSQVSWIVSALRYLN